MQEWSQAPQSVQIASMIKSWKSKFEDLSLYLKCPADIKIIIYTIYIIETVYMQFRKLTKTKWRFPEEDILLKLLYISIQNGRWHSETLAWLYSDYP